MYRQMTEASTINNTMYIKRMYMYIHVQGLIYQDKPNGIIIIIISPFLQIFVLSTVEAQRH